jgi:hypothetical protein
MTVKEIKYTLDYLRNTIAYQRYGKGNDGKIRVRMGIDLARWIKTYYSYYYIYKTGDPAINSIFGCPLEIDDANPMCLEVLIVERVPVYRESEV